MLWSIFEQGKALTSLTTEDAIAYRAFLRRPSPRARWVGPSRFRTSPDWKPFQGALAPRSIAYALSVIGALYRWLIEQRYTLANPFAGIKVKGSKRDGAFDSSRGFSEHEWDLVRANADGIECLGGWSEEAAQRLRFTLDFWYATGLRPSEIAHARLGDIEYDMEGDPWLKVIGKGSKSGKVVLPLLATGALDRYLAHRGLPVTRGRWDPATVLIGNLSEEGAGITASRLGVTMRRFFLYSAKKLVDVSPTTAEKLQRASSHWMRHTHATHALGRGADLTVVRDNLRHASVATTSVYLHADEVKRARQIGAAFLPRPDRRADPTR
jgi:site-specific recombinase XerD